MKVRFLQDYRGRLTNETFYTIGTEVDLPNGSDLVAEGRAEAVVVDAEEPSQVDAKPKSPKALLRNKGKNK